MIHFLSEAKSPIYVFKDKYGELNQMWLSKNLTKRICTINASFEKI